MTIQDSRNSSIDKRQHAKASTQPNFELREALTFCEALSGDHMVVETPVPIPNTAVKHNQPMIVPTSAKVGIAGFIYSTKAPAETYGAFLLRRGGFLRLGARN